MKNSIKQIKSNTANRVFFNTIIIYVQRFSTAALALVTTPLLLRVLGVEDYGVYTLTIGFVGMLTFFTWSLSSSTQRYIAVTLGEKNYEKLSKILSSSLLIHVIYGVLILVLIQVVNFFYVNSILNIPENREESIHYILSFVAGISFFNIISIPFIGALRAYEDFVSIAVIGVIESSSKLLMAFLLFFIGGDKLVTFSGLMFLVSFVIFVLYFMRVTFKKDSIFKRLVSPDKGLIKEMLSFISWTLLGALAVMSRNQGVSVILNIFFGVVTNAAYGISQQVNNAINILSQGVTGSIGPLLMKSAGEKNYDKMLYMMRTMSKMSYFSISLFSIPLFFEMPFVLKIWLKDVPPDSVIFARLIIVSVLLLIMSSGMQNVFVSIGKVKIYNLYVSLLLIFNLPISYLLFSLGFPNYSVIIVGILLEFISLLVRLNLLNKYLGYKIKTFGKEVLQILLPTVIVTGLLTVLMYIPLPDFVRFVLSFGISLLLSPFIIYRYSLDEYQRNYSMNILIKLKLKKPKK